MKVDCLSPVFEAYSQKKYGCQLQRLCLTMLEDSIFNQTIYSKNHVDRAYRNYFWNYCSILENKILSVT